MSRLTANQESFVEMMRTSDEHARHGFDVLLARKDPERFFDALIQAGLFEANKNPGIVPADEPGHYRVPYWRALDYLQSMAALADKHNDEVLAGKVMDIIRKVSSFRDAANKPRENHH